MKTASVWSESVSVGCPHEDCGEIIPAPDGSHQHTIINRYYDRVKCLGCGRTIRLAENYVTLRNQVVRASMARTARKRAASCFPPD